MQVETIAQMIEELAPLSLAMDFDHVGLMVGDSRAAVSKVLIALDLTEAVVEEAVAKGAEMIIAHHPFLFDPLFSVTDKTVKGRIVMQLIKNNIAYYAAHTNMDIAKGGINDYLFDLLKLKDREILEPVSEDDGLGRIGCLDHAMDPDSFLRYVKTCLGCSRVLYTGQTQTIHRVAICSGSGTSLAERAVALGADALITADMKYSVAQALEGIPLLLVDCGHYGTEHFFCDIVANLLTDKVAVEIAESNCDYIKELTI